MSRIGKSQKIPFNITCTGATAAILVFGLKTSDTVIECFYYGITPATAQAAISEDFTVDWTAINMTELTLTEGVFSGTMSEESTQNAVSDMLVMDFKAWNATENVIQRFEVKYLGDTYVKKVVDA